MEQTNDRHLRPAGERNGTVNETRRERLVHVLAFAAFLIFFQAYMVAPLLPHLGRELGVSVQTMGLVVSAYLIPYGITTLLYGLLSDHVGRKRLIFGSLVMFTVLTALTATASNLGAFAAWRFVTGCGASAVVPLGLVIVGALFPFEQRGRPLGWLFGAMAGGMALGSSFGAVLEPLIGWRGLFIGTGALGAVILVALVPYRDLLGAPSTTAPRVRELGKAYRALLSTARARRTYSYVLLNAVFHSGIFTWLGFYFEVRFGLGGVGIGIALLGYGVPGFVFGPLLGRLADRFGRNRLIPLGVAIAAISAGLLALPVPLAAAVVLVTALSLGYDMTQPMLAGIVTSLGGSRPGLAMGFNVFALFVGFGAGSIAFGALLASGFAAALAIFAGFAALGALFAIALFASEASNAAE